MLKNIVKFCFLVTVVTAQVDDIFEPNDRQLPEVITDWETEPDAELRKLSLIPS